MHDCFHRFQKSAEKGSVSSITGSPGRTLLYALQQALLYDGATVLFFFQTSGDAVLYLRRNNRIYVLASKSRGEADSALFKRSDVFVLLDPDEAKKKGAYFHLGKMKLLYAASNNKLHFKGSGEKEYEKMQAFLGPPMDTELFVILKKLDPTLKQNVFRKRKEKVGNLIRYILDDGKYDIRNAATIQAIQDCAGDTKKLQQTLDDNGISGERHIPETLFHVLPRRPELNDAISMGYDGQNATYRERVVLAPNSYVQEAILNAGRQLILSYWGKVSCDEFSTMDRTRLRNGSSTT